MSDACGTAEPEGHKAVVIGGSAGGLKAFAAILAALPADYALPVLLVQHLHPSDDGAFARNLASTTHLSVIEAGDKQPIERGHVYVAPANYHMLMERNGTIALSLEERVHWSRPSIDVLFESAALVLKEKLIAVILSGASVDGAAGIQTIKAVGGLTLAQDPSTAEYPLMPQAAIDTGAVDEVLTIAQMSKRLVELGRPVRA
ncbi:MAG: chemotaxis protein CheB [Desulfobulbus sp.]|nr:chemotaxis protein CheB [Desulfobulbus sp.]